MYNTRHALYQLISSYENQYSHSQNRRTIPQLNSNNNYLRPRPALDRVGQSRQRIQLRIGRKKKENTKLTTPQNKIVSDQTGP